MSVRGPQGNGYIFLSSEWVREVTRAVQLARKTNEYFRKLSNGYSLRLMYVIRNIPEALRRHYGGGGTVAIYVQLEKGVVRKIRAGSEFSGEPVDFTIHSEYEVAKQIFQGELTPTSSFMNRLFRVEPLERFYRRPRFAAKSVVTGNVILRIARQVPTVFEPAM